MCSYNHSVALNFDSITCRSLISRVLTLLVEFPDDSVQVGVLERNVTASHRHFGAEREDFSDTLIVQIRFFKIH